MLPFFEGQLQIFCGCMQSSYVQLIQNNYLQNILVLAKEFIFELFYVARVRQNAYERVWITKWTFLIFLYLCDLIFPRHRESITCCSKLIFLNTLDALVMTQFPQLVRKRHSVHYSGFMLGLQEVLEKESHFFVVLNVVQD